MVGGGRHIAEVCLAGEIRAVNQIEGRITEAAKLGFKSAVIPKGNMAEVGKVKGIKIIPVSHVREAMSLFQ